MLFSNKWLNKRNGLWALLGLLGTAIAIYFGGSQNNTITTSLTISGNNNNQTQKNQIITGNNNIQVGGDYKQTTTNIYNYTDTTNPNYLNERSPKLKGLQPKDLVWQFYSLQNQGGPGYRDACSLLQSKKSNGGGCDVTNGDDVSHFSNYVQTLQNGYEHIYLTGSKKLDSGNSKIICARFDYKPNTKSYPGYVTEFWRIKLMKRDDKEWEIVSKSCEKKSIENKGPVKCGDYEAGDKLCLPFLG